MREKRRNFKWIVWAEVQGQVPETQDPYPDSWPGPGLGPARGPAP